MATKYIREARESRGFDRTHPMLRQWRRITHMPLRRRLTIIYLGIIVMAGLLALTPFLQRRGGFQGQAMVPGQGVVVAKETRQDPQGEAHYLEIRVNLPGRGQAEDSVPVSPEDWNRFAPGDRIGVLYRLSRGGTAVEILEIGIEKLPD